MLNTFLSKYMLKKIIEQKVPTMKTRRCINNLQRRQSCNLCESHCPSKAISIDKEIKIDKEKCDNCSVCVSLCPTGNLVPTYDVVEKQYGSLYKNENVSICCDKCQVNGDFRVNCLAVLPWEYIAYICLDNKVSLYIKDCYKCENRNLFNKFNETLEKVNDFLGEEIYRERIFMINDEKALPVKEYTRRELLMLWSEQSKKIATTVVPIDFEENKNSRIYRDLLIKKLNNIKDKNLMYNWPSIKINSDKCWSCRICEKLCPQKAISIKDDEVGKGKFIHSHLKCSHCGVCKIVCLSNAIELTSIQASVNEKNTEHIVKYLKCSVCGDPIEEDDMGTCITCKNKSRY